MSAWEHKVRPYDPNLANQLTGATDPYAVTADLRLPTPDYVLFDTLAEFMHDPAAGLERLAAQGVANFYAGARSADPRLSGVRNEQPLAAADIVDFLKDRIAPEDYGRYKLRIAEFLAGVSVVGIADILGTVELDISHRWLLPDLTSGLQTPDFRASNDNAHSILRYFDKDESGNWTDDALRFGSEDVPLNTAVRTAIWRAVKAMRQHPGYYEFAVVVHHGLRMPIFAEAIPNKGGRNRALSLPISYHTAS